MHLEDGGRRSFKNKQTNKKTSHVSSSLFKREQPQRRERLFLAARPFKPPHGIIYLPHVQQTTLPPKIFINADSQLKWLQIKAESVIIERVLSWMTIKRHLIRRPAKSSSKTTISMHSVMDIMDNYPECTTQPHSCLQLRPKQLPPPLHPSSFPHDNFLQLFRGVGIFRTVTRVGPSKLHED